MAQTWAKILSWGPWAGYGWFCKPMAQARPYFLAWQFSRLDGKGMCILKGSDWLTYLAHKDVNRLGQAGTTVSSPISLYNEESESRSNTLRSKYALWEIQADPESLPWRSQCRNKKKAFERAIY